MKSCICVAIVATAVGRDVSDDWMDWECPGFPCFVANYFDGREHTDIRQTCTPLSTMMECKKLINGENFPAINSADGSIAGWHNSTQGHPCSAATSCDQAGGCLQGTKSKCVALCAQMNLISPYGKRCTDRCARYCPEPSDDIPCSECETHGQGADQCGCGYCGSYGGCGWTCGNDPNKPAAGPKCVSLPPAPSPTPVQPPTPSPTPSPAPGPNPNLPAGGCCSWASESELDECGESTDWCKANAANCEGCEGHWACPDGPCPAPAPSPIPSTGCCSWAKTGQSETCGDSTSYCKASYSNCASCQGHWVYPKAEFACSECVARGHGADQCACGYCDSFGGCGWTCGHDSSHRPSSPRCDVGSIGV